MITAVQDSQAWNLMFVLRQRSEMHAKKKLARETFETIFGLLLPNSAPNKYWEILYK